MGHQDNDLELRALLAEQEAAAEKIPEAPAPELVAVELAETPAAMDHDEIGAWRKTARFFRQAA